MFIFQGKMQYFPSPYYCQPSSIPHTKHFEGKKILVTCLYFIYSANIY